MGESVKTVAYLINMCPCSAIKFKTPMEMWSENPFDYEDLKVFASIAYAHIRRDKFERHVL